MNTPPTITPEPKIVKGDNRTDMNTENMKGDNPQNDIVLKGQNDIPILEITNP